MRISNYLLACSIGLLGIVGPALPEAVGSAIGGMQLRLSPSIALDVKTYGGAAGNGTTDDRAAIQRTIDAVRDYVRSNGNCRGVVTFPAGTYKVSLNLEQVAQVGKGMTVGCLNVYANITLQGPTSGAPARIKLADNTGPHICMISDWTGNYNGRGIDNFTMANLTLDGNSSNSPVPCEAGTLNCQGAFSTFHHLPTTNITLQRCVFQDFASVNTISFGGVSNYCNVMIDGCAFTGTGRPKNSRFPGNDHSTIYSGPNYTTVRNCSFVSCDGPGTKGVACAMEMHGHNQSCISNYVSGYDHAVNLVGDASGYDNQYCVSNIFDKVASGVAVWPVHDMQNVIIDGNTMNLTPGLWTDPVKHIDLAAQSSGVTFSTAEPACTGLVTTIWITNNRINYIRTGPRIDFYNSWFNQLSAGIQLFNCMGVNRLNHLYIVGNTIDHPLSNGIWAWNPTTDCWIHQNTIIDPGSSTNLTNGRESTCAVWWTAGSGKGDDHGQYANGLWITAAYGDENVFVDDRPVHRMWAGLWTNAKAGTNGAGYAQGQASGLAPGGVAFGWDGGAAPPPLGGWELY